MADSAEPRDLHAPEPRGGRYSAFISYSHADGQFAKRLHRLLERYRLPRRARIRADGVALAGDRLKPLFRDVDELTAAPDLTAAVREAIADSDHLIVVCSPGAAASSWVAKEIELFRSLHGDAGILAVLANGEPGEAFPPALAGPGYLEPLAADFRGDAASRRLSLLKLIARLAGVRLDELIQRDSQRRLRILAFTGGGAFVGAAVVAGLAIAALNARADADAERSRTSGLNEFLATDLRKGLEAAGRHDLLDKVNRAALNSYKSEDLSHLTPNQLEQRATLLQGSGEDAEKRGDLATARAQFEAARRATAALLAADPSDPKRLFAHAQSEYWDGFINWREGDAAGARAGFQAYARLADRLVAVDPTNTTWRKEKVFAAGDLGMLALRQAGDPTAAERYFRMALAELDAIAKQDPEDPDLMMQRANGLGWLADAQRLGDHLREAEISRAAQRSILQKLLVGNPRNVEVKRYLLFNELAVARIALAQGATDQALSQLEAGRLHGLALQSQDPDNKDYPKQARMFELFEARTWLDMPPNRRPPTKRIADLLGDCHVRGPGSDNLEISDFCGVLLARVRIAQRDRAGAEAAIAPVRVHAAARHDVLTARWGLNLVDEVRPVQMAESKGGKE